MSDVGTFRLPADFPFHAMRKNGWYDKRRKITKDIERYIGEFEAKHRNCYLAGSERPGFEAPSFAEWLKS